MSKIINKFYDVIDKIGKRNFILAIFVLIVFIVGGLYTTFSMYTEFGGISIVDGVKTYNFILNNNNDNNSITVSSGSSRVINVKISNPDDIALKYGLYYSSIDSLLDVYIGYQDDTDKLPVDTIEANQDYVVSLKILNLSSDSVTIDFGVSYGLEQGGELVLPSGKSFVELYDGPVLLSEVEVGSYVDYAGNNGCVADRCDGTNVNYRNVANMGYCYYDGYTYKSNGFRVGYIKNNTAYLISGGALECISTDEAGSMALDNVDSYDITNGATMHVSNLNKMALNYCNKEFAYMGVCDNRSSWAMDVTDFRNITGSVLASDSCYNKENSEECGYNNDLIDNGGYYWFASHDNGLKNSLYVWDPENRRVNHYYSSFAMGLRPVIRMDSSVYAVSGDGSYDNPYVLGVFGEDKNNDDVSSDNNIDTLATTYIKNLYNDGSITNVKIGVNNDIEISLNKDKSILFDNNKEYRYYGKTPNNYIEFNDELWRIISISNVSSDNDTNPSERVKIIRDEVLGTYSFDSSDSSINNGYGVNDWSKSDLMNELNDLYYNSKKGECYIGDNNKKEECDFSNIGLSEEAKKLVDNALYYMGNNGTISNNYINEYYKLERTSGTWIGKVGIMYASDYLYASDLSLCKNTGNNYSNDSNCYDNWLFNKDGNQNILLISDSTDSNYVLSKDGNIEKITGDNGYVSQPRVVKPVLYLNNNVKIVSGTGAKSDPYKLSI